MEQYADVIIDTTARALDREFQYRVPQHLTGRIRVGSQVEVPFGNGDRRMMGIVTDLSEEPKIHPSRIKELSQADERALSVQGKLLSLAAWMHEQYDGTLSQAIKTVMPVKRQMKQKNRVRYILTDREAARAFYEKIKKGKSQKARARFLEALLLSPDDSISSETAAGILQVSRQSILGLVKAGLVKEETQRIYRSSSRLLEGRWKKVALSIQQEQVAEDLLHSWERVKAAGEQKTECTSSDRVHLLHGITGSGKTEVYLAVLEEVRRQGYQAIVLIPEISLTLQTVSRFYERFGEDIAIMHSRLSEGERFDQYTRARQGLANIMIGPRSALFTPFEKLGLIIIDEEHETSYKSESSPKYLARDVAIRRAQMEGAMVILGSATPSLSSYYNTVTGRYSLHTLQIRARQGSMLPDVQIVDLREEFKKKNMSILSLPLQEAMEETLARGEQVMLFLNRRGYAGFVSCRSCGYVFKCRHCDVSMTIHSGGLLKCHYCGYEVPLPKICPSCGSPHIAGFGLGTQKVEETVTRRFPKARITRMDRDTTSGKDDMGRLLQEFAEGRSDVLIGTQMIVKGHDFEKVTLVGIIAADLSMFSGDYLSSERTFQLLTQAAGRAGRAELKGKVIIQTYRPDDSCVRLAARQDYLAFYQEEMRFRTEMGYPPAAQLLMIGLEGPSEDTVLHAAQILGRELHEAAGTCFSSVLGPSRAGISKIKDQYRYVLYVKSPGKEQSLAMVRTARDAVAGFEDAFRNVYVSFDSDPYRTF